ncbi:NADH-quinone oxidoreductase subunit M [Spongiactinospora rosea]|uniref:NADH-quinone oxidoreductase subunit M n=1 Tax=Spongiactinospora rosea TaxID=2248750 RepID=A0A366M8K4_9ACTN|nr:NADH-quinone oxidoreductase subunit M [Spongiactinospora rosea]RBQ21792.1 NADH-quinone oxidoreductase subunit M [Spongiactinospora rosea]
MNWLPIAILAVPLLGALAALAGRNGPGSARVLRWHSLAVSAVTFVLTVLLAATFDHGDAARMQFVTDLPWIPGLAIHFHLGVDGISLPLVVLTSLLTLLCFVYLAGTGSPRPRALVFALLLLEVGMLGTFLALDLLLFFVFFEVVLIPMYFVIAIWGGQGRRAAAVKFILYTLLGSVILLLGLLLVWAQTGTLDMVALARTPGAGMTRAAQVLAFVAIGLGLAVKTPMWPLHTWLPDAHTEAPTVGSVLLAGVLLKMGTYGFARIAIPILPEGAAAVAPWLGAFAVVGIIYGALACLAQRDLKRMIAYSSVGHMGFVLLGFATLTPVGINAALFGNIAHGLITGLLFFLAGAIKDRYGTADMPSMGGGMLTRIPRLGALLTFACIASLGIPGLAGFWGEMLALLGAFTPGPGLPRPLYLVFMALGGIGAVLTAAYFLIMLSRTTHGPTTALATSAPDSADTATLPVAGASAETVAFAGVSSPVQGSASTSSDPPLIGTVEAGPGAVAPPSSPGTAVPPDPAASAPGWDVGEGSGAGSADSGGLPEAGGSMPDVRGFELAAWVPLIALIVLLGLWPKALLLLTTPAVQAILGTP